jgi:hypothetical protein
MGLYQYIREQQHRHDLIGELGQWMSKHYGERPDQTNLAFKLAYQEFAACENWTKQDALERLNKNEKFRRIVKFEPRLSQIISEVLKISPNHSYNRDQEYSFFKVKINKLVGYESEKDAVVDSNSYEVIIQVIADLLPPDKSVLYPDGIYEYESLELDL